MTKLDKMSLYDYACRMLTQWDECPDKPSKATVEMLAEDLYEALREITESWDELTSGEED